MKSFFSRYRNRNNLCRSILFPLDDFGDKPFHFYRRPNGKGTFFEKLMKKLKPSAITPFSKNQKSCSWFYFLFFLILPTDLGSNRTYYVNGGRVFPGSVEEVITILSHRRLLKMLAPGTLYAWSIGIEWAYSLCNFVTRKMAPKSK